MSQLETTQQNTLVPEFCHVRGHCPVLLGCCSAVCGPAGVALPAILGDEAGSRVRPPVLQAGKSSIKRVTPDLMSIP
jgi:hypothetical protein